MSGTPARRRSFLPFLLFSDLGSFGHHQCCCGMFPPSQLISFYVWWRMISSCQSATRAGLSTASSTIFLQQFCAICFKDSRMNLLCNCFDKEPTRRNKSKRKLLLFSFPATQLSKRHRSNTDLLLYILQQTAQFSTIFFFLQLTFYLKVLLLFKIEYFTREKFDIWNKFCNFSLQNNSTKISNYPFPVLFPLTFPYFLLV